MSAGEQADLKRANVTKRLEAEGLVAVIRTRTPELAVEVSRALFSGGMKALEITVTVPEAPRVIQALQQELEGAILGAGSVVDAGSCEQCLDAGAEFIVSPAMLPALLPFIHRRGAAAFLGAMTPTEAVNAWQAGADYVKVFPAPAVGGASFLKALLAPLPHLKCVPTGGVSLDTLADYVAAGATLLGIGGAVSDAALLKREGPSALEALARRYTQAYRDARASSR
jgi:2-dehydro-3-deoxyphosphogluconate aldolase/(4S)-4-hydroxy-2-oxoglutarate aldolase